MVSKGGSYEVWCSASASFLPATNLRANRYTPRNRETYPFFLFFCVFLAEKHQGNVFRVLETPKNTCFYDIYYYAY